MREKKKKRLRRKSPDQKTCPGKKDRKRSGVNIQHPRQRPPGEIQELKEEGAEGLQKILLERASASKKRTSRRMWERGIGMSGRALKKLEGNDRIGRR